MEALKLNIYYVLPKALITLPKAKRPQLMEMPSFARSPVAPVRLSRSEPAKSTKWNLAVSVSMSPTLVEPSLVFSSSSSKWNGFSFLACRCCCKSKPKIVNKQLLKSKQTAFVNKKLSQCEQTAYLNV